MSDMYIVQRKRNVKISFTTISGVLHEVVTRDGEYAITKVKDETMGYIFVVLLGRVGYSCMYREKYMCIDYSITKVISVKTKFFKSSVDDMVDSSDDD